VAARRPPSECTDVPGRALTERGAETGCGTALVTAGDSGRSGDVSPAVGTGSGATCSVPGSWGAGCWETGLEGGGSSAPPELASVVVCTVAPGEGVVGCWTGPVEVGAGVGAG